MDNALAAVLALLVGLFDLIAAAIAAIEDGTRRLLAEAGITGEVQSAILVVVLALLIVAAFRLFGRLLAVLLAVVLLLVLLHALLAGHPVQI